MRGMQTDNNVFIRLSTLSTLKEERIRFGSRDLQFGILKEISFASKVTFASQIFVSNLDLQSQFQKFQ